MLKCMLECDGIFHSLLLHRINNEMYAFAIYIWIRHTQGCNVSRCVANNAYQIYFKSSPECLSFFSHITITLCYWFWCYVLFLSSFFVFAACIYTNMYQTEKHLHTNVDKKNKSNNQPNGHGSCTKEGDFTRKLKKKI